MTDVDDWGETPEEYAAAQARAEEPPDSYFEEESQEQAARHSRDTHGGGECDCPVAEPDYAEEAPF